MRKVAQIMGMPISIDIPDSSDPAVFELAFQRLRQVDARFSTYKPGSEVSRYAAGKIDDKNLSDELKSVITACKKAETETEGYFSAWAGGSFDPSGYVKGWAVAEAGKVIERQGFGTYCIGAGGDIMARGNQDWVIGIQDPMDKTKILNTLSISTGAVCTSGSYERGAHIFNPKTKAPAEGLTSVTVWGPDIIQADILATALFAMGQLKAKDLIAKNPDYQAIFV